MPEFKFSQDDPRFMLERWGTIVDRPPQGWEQTITEIVRFIDEGVDLLRNPKAILNHDINKLMANFWRLVGTRVTPFAIAESLPMDYDKGLFFWCEKKPLDGRVAYLATIMCPMNWLELIRQDRWRQMGGLVFAASNANDFWHKKLQEGSALAWQMRSAAWEAEFLHYLAHWPDAGFSPDPYQQKVMQAFPKGLASLDSALRYDLVPVVSADFAKIEGKRDVC